MRSLALLALVGCTPKVPVSSDFKLTVTRVSQSSKLAGAVTDPQTIFVMVELTLTNQTSAAAPLAAPLFVLETSDGLQVNGDGATVYHPRGCQQAASLSPGASNSCVTVFRLAAGATPSKLTYQRGDGHEAAADVHKFDRCVSCGADCLDVSGDDPANCGGCGAMVGIGTCAAGKPSCNQGASLCGKSCVDLKSDPANCGKCGTAVGSDMSCQKGKPICNQMGFNLCGDRCIYEGDPAFCGCTPCADGLCICDTSKTGGCDWKCLPTCATQCGATACTTSTATYRCTPTTGVGFEQSCSPPPHTRVDPDTGLTCSLSALDCQCT